MILSLIAAAAISSASDIRTGADLLAACQQKDTRACDAFIEETMRNATPGCNASRGDVEQVRQGVIRFFQRSWDLGGGSGDYRKNPASEIVAAQSDGCGAGDAHISQ